MKPEPNFDFEIDLGEIFLTLWRRRWIILIATLVTTLGAAGINLYLIPNQYQAAATISIQKPILNFQIEESANLTQRSGNTNILIDVTKSPDIEANQILPDINSLMDLAKSPALMKGVLEDPTLVSSGIAQNISDAKLAGMLAVSTVGQNQLRLQVTDQDPKRVALLANAMARQVTEYINNTYDINIILQSLTEQVSMVKKNYDQAQAAFEGELTRNNVDVVEVELNNAIGDLNCKLQTENAIARLMTDLDVQKQHFLISPTESEIQIGNTLVLLDLQQRAELSKMCAEGSPTVQIQFTGDTLTLLPPSRALEITSQIQSDLQTKNASLQAEKTLLEQKIPKLKSKIETGKNTMFQLIQARDHSRAFYNALIQKQDQAKVLLINGNQIATVSIQALTPAEKSSPRVASNTTLAGLAGLMLAVLTVLANDWLQKSIHKSQAGK